MRSRKCTCQQLAYLCRFEDELSHHKTHVSLYRYKKASLQATQGTRFET
jgi:hypothetical protein